MAYTHVLTREGDAYGVKSLMQCDIAPNLWNSILHWDEEPERFLIVH